MRNKFSALVAAIDEAVDMANADYRYKRDEMPKRHGCGECADCRATIRNASVHLNAWIDAQRLAHAVGANRAIPD